MLAERIVHENIKQARTFAKYLNINFFRNAQV